MPRWSPARRGGTYLGVVAHHHTAAPPAMTLERVDVRANPTRRRLAPASFGVGVIERPERHDEDVGASLFSPVMASNTGASVADPSTNSCPPQHASDAWSARPSSATTEVLQE